MSSAELVCSNCHIPVDDRGCSRCWWMTPLPKVVRRTSLTIYAGGGGYPIPDEVGVAPTAASAGSDSFLDESFNTRTLQIAGVTLTSDQMLVIGIGHNTSQAGNVTSVVWGAASGTQRLEGVSAAGDHYCDVWIINPGVTDTRDIDIEFDPFGSAPVSAVSIAVIVSGFNATPIDTPLPGDLTSNTFGFANATSASEDQSGVGGTPNSYFPDLGLAFLMTAGPSTDDAGSWSGLDNVLRVGTTGGASEDVNSTLSVGSYTTTSAGAQVTTKSGFTARNGVISVAFVRPA